MIKKRWLLITLCLHISAACDRGFNSNIPDAPVSLTCDLNMNFVQITTPGQFVTVTKIDAGYLISSPKSSLPVKTQKAQSARLGYGGLIIGSSVYNGYCAFDATCPVETNTKILVSIKNEGLGIAVCAKCGTEYSLNDNGMPTKGEGREPLKNYKTSLISDKELRVYN